MQATRLGSFPFSACGPKHGHRTLTGAKGFYMAHLTAKSSTIFIAAEGATKVYRSVDEVPEKLRQRLVESTHGVNAATILIADKRGREELVRALQGRPSDLQCRVVNTLRSRKGDSVGAKVNQSPSSQPLWQRLKSVRTWLELLVPVAIGASLWFFIESHF